MLKQLLALDTKNLEDGGIIFAIGCANGKIYLRYVLLNRIINVRIDWEEMPKGFEC